MIRRAVIVALLAAAPVCFVREMVPERSIPNRWSCREFFRSARSGPDGVYGWRVCRDFHTGYRRMDCGWWGVGAPGLGEVWYRVEP